jgi:phosphopantetheine--protein transferase-like protein
MKERIISIIAPFVKLNPEQVDEQTLIGRRAVASSIILHRMYARLAAEGFVVADYWGIETVGALLGKLANEQPDSVNSENLLPVGGEGKAGSGSQVERSIGIDAQPIRDFEAVTDFRQDEFYKMNFSGTEIAWCQLQRQPIISFAGLFAAKEAMVKSDNRLINTSFNRIVIDHLPSGKPLADGFHISITHSDELAIAVAIPNEFFNNQHHGNRPLTDSSGSNSRPLERILIALAFFLSLLAFLWSVFH